MLKMLSLSLMKIRIVTGGLFMLAASLAVSLGLFFTARAALDAPAPERLTLAVVDGDGSEAALELVRLVSGDERVELLRCADMSEADELILNGEAEGVLVIEAGLQGALVRGQAALSFFAAPDTASEEAARELIAGAAAAVGSRLRSEMYASALLERGLTEDERALLREKFYQKLSDEGAAVHEMRVGGEPGRGDAVSRSRLLGAFFARYSGFSAFVIMLVLLMLGASVGRRDVRSCSLRLRTVEGGAVFDALSDVFALALVGLMLLALSYLPSAPRGVVELIAGALYVLNAAALAVLAGGLSSDARSELLLPFTAFLTSLIGGCFVSSDALGGALAAASRFTPQGMYLASLGGEHGFLFVLLLLALLFVLGVMLLRRRVAQAR